MSSVESKFKFHQNLNSLIIEENKIDELVKYINKPEYRLDQIDFLRQCPNINCVYFYGDKITNFTGMYHLINLKYLYADEPKGELNVSHFKDLEELQVNDSKFLVGVNECHNLKFLQLTKYKPKSKNLIGLSKLTNLETLKLYIPNVTSLEGIQHLLKLKEVELYRASKLESIKELDGIKNNLKKLEIETCKKIQKPETVTCLQNLETLKFINCGELENIHFINQMLNLKQFIFIDTNIVDGDLSPCIGLEYSGFFNKKHYSHTFNELNDEKYWDR